MNTPAQNRTLSATKTRALEALLRFGTVREAAKQARIGRTTLHEWLRDESFRAALHRERRELHEAAIRRLHARESEAVDVLTGLLRSKDEKIRLSAAREILELTRDAQQEERLEAVEARLDTETSKLSETELREFRKRARDLLFERMLEERSQKQPATAVGGPNTGA